MEINKSDQIGQLASALATAQGQMDGAKKDSSNPFFRSKYADLASVWEACRKPLANNGLSVIQLPGRNEQGNYLDTILLHSSGECLAGRLPVRPGYTDKAGNFVALEDPQSMGSAITYARRYALQAAVGIAPEDDDGNAASGKQFEETKAQPLKRGPVGEPINKQSATLPENEVPGTSTVAGDYPEPSYEPKSIGGSGGWGDVVWHFGDNKGIRLGDFSEKDLTYWAKNYEPKPYKGKISPQDTALRQALDQAREELSKKEVEAPETVTQESMTDHVLRLLKQIDKTEAQLLEQLASRKVISSTIKSVDALPDGIKERVINNWDEKVKNWWN